MPVVAVHDLGRKVQRRDRVQHGAAEEGVLLALGLVAAVDPVAEILLVVDQIEDDAVHDQLFNADIGQTPAELAVEMAEMLGLAGVFILDDAVIGGDDARVDIQRTEGLGQCADHVGKTSGLGQRHALGGGEEHLRHLLAPALLQHIAEFLFHLLFLPLGVFLKM